jgi:hypothetical protein
MESEIAPRRHCEERGDEAIQIDVRIVDKFTVMPGRVPRLSGLILVDEAHGVDSSVLQAFGDVLGHGEGSSHAASE